MGLDGRGIPVVGGGQNHLDPQGVAPQSSLCHERWWLRFSVGCIARRRKEMPRSWTLTDDDAARCA